MQFLIPILFAIGIAIVIVLLSVHTKRSLMSEFRSQIATLQGLSNREAMDRVMQLGNNGCLQFMQYAAPNINQPMIDRLGEVTNDFYLRYAGVREKNFEFYPPSSKRQIKGGDYYVIGSTVNGNTTYLVQELNDTVFSMDKEDADIDSDTRMPSIWHAILFECYGNLK